MSGRIPREFIENLLLRVDIVDLIDSFVPLKKAGSSFVARCPFHSEKSPSFSVNRKKQFYHCFGCGAGGNAISFLMAFSHLDFVEAVEDLATYVGVDVPREVSGFQQKQDFTALYSILEQVAVFYVEQLRSNSSAALTAVNYLKQRGLSGDIAKQYSLGYAPDEWDATASRFDNDRLVEAGVLVRNEAGRCYDRFRGRLIFPIRDKRKRIIGFGGRVLGDSLPKYLNSPETPVFSKAHELYGLYELLEKNAKPKRILIVEGYMDVLALAQYGVGYSVAALGTATSKMHLDLLFRFTAELVFCFDGDEAGKKAAWRAVKEAFPCLKDGRQIRVMLLPLGEDPDSLVREIGLQAFEQQIEQARVLSDYFFDFLASQVDLNTAEGRAVFLAEAKPFLEKIPAGFFREMMFSRMTDLAALDVSRNPAKLLESDRPQVQVQGRPLPKSKPAPIRVVVALLLQNPGLIEVVEKQALNLSVITGPGSDVLRLLVQTITEKKPLNAAMLLEHFRGTAQEKILNTLVNEDYFILQEGVEAEFIGALQLLLQQGDEQKLELLLSKERESGLDESEKELLKKLLNKRL